MTRLAAVLLLAGCNQILGIRGTRSIDAQQFDAPVDAPFACPQSGALAFSPVLHQAVLENCFFYTQSTTAGLAAATCVDLDSIADGPIDGPLVGVTLVGPINDSTDVPRLTPEGDELWLRRTWHTGTGPSVINFSVYRRTADHVWEFVRDLGFTPATRDESITAPSQRVGGVRHFVRHAFLTNEVVEYTDDGTTTVELHRYAARALGVDFVQYPNLVADGRILVFVSTPAGARTARVYLSHRTSLDVTFPVATANASAPVAFDPFLTADCARLYSNGLGSVFFAQQQ